MLSTTCTYGIRATVYLAARESGAFVPVRRVADALGLSGHFLSKVFQSLATGGIVETYRGPNGGVRLARPASSISVRDLVVALDGPSLFEECVLGLPGCGEDTPCPLHAQWAEQRTRIERVLSRQSLAALAKGYSGGSLRLSIGSDDLVGTPTSGSGPLEIQKS